MSWNPDGLLKMMQVNSEIFGEEILQVKDASDEWLIDYFKGVLFDILHYLAKAESKLFIVEASRFGGIDKIIPKKIDLSKEQCSVIGNELLRGIVMIDILTGKPRINYWDSQIILNYIEKGYSFFSSYKLIKTD